jgi:UDP-N-acetylglucosamine 1-carboxyvinyltransferase
MEKLVIEGGHALHGAIPVSGAKNAALPILIATLVAPGEHRLANIPDLADTSSTLSLLGRIGCPSLVNGVVKLDTSRIAFSEAPYDVVRKMRASVLVLGPLLARTGEAKVSLPGGCAIGTRPIDQHLKGLEALGCTFELSGGYIHGRVADLRGADILLDMPTVTGTENILMAAVLARGTTHLRNAAREPEVEDLCRFLVSLGAKIEGIGTSTLVIEGVSRLTPASRPYRIVPDRIEAGTYLCAGAAAGGDITVTGVEPAHLEATIGKLQQAGCELEVGTDTVRLRRTGKLLPFRLRTEPYPGFATDMQAQLMTLACLAEGTSTIEETIFENRFMHAAELLRMGADIATTARVATVRGTGRLSGAAVMASDLRASAALVLAGLAAEGMTQVLRIYHLDRGYENLVGKLRAVGARIGRIADNVQSEDRLRACLDAPLSAAAGGD